MQVMDLMQKANITVIEKKKHLSWQGAKNFACSVHASHRRHRRHA
jgi:hypothetical protein